MTPSFDENRRPIPTCEPVYPDDCPEAGPLAPRQADAEAVMRLLGWLCADGDPMTAGRKAYLTAALLHLPPVGGLTHQQLAERLGVSRSRVTQLLTSLRDESGWSAMG